jgi:glucose-6-phosphate isomerase
MSDLTSSPAWQALSLHHDKIRKSHMRDLFMNDPQRFARFSLQFEDILLDYSKNIVTQETMGLLLDLARQAEVENQHY